MNKILSQHTELSNTSAQKKFSIYERFRKVPNEILETKGLRANKRIILSWMLGCSVDKTFTPKKLAKEMGKGVKTIENNFKWLLKNKFIYKPFYGKYAVCRDKILDIVKNYTQIRLNVLKHHGLKGGEWTVISYLLKHSDNQYINVKNTATALGYRNSTVSGYFRSLRKKGLLFQERYDHQKFRYHVNKKLLEEMGNINCKDFIKENPIFKKQDRHFSEPSQRHTLYSNKRKCKKKILTTLLVSFFAREKIELHSKIVSGLNSIRQKLGDIPIERLKNALKCSDFRKYLVNEVKMPGAILYKCATDDTYTTKLDRQNSAKKEKYSAEDEIDQKKDLIRRVNRKYNVHIRITSNPSNGNQYVEYKSQVKNLQKLTIPDLNAWLRAEIKP